MGGHSFIRDRSVHYNADACVLLFEFFMRVDGCTLVYIISKNDARSMCGIFVQRHPTMGKVIKPVYADVCLFMRLMVCSGGGLWFMKMG